MSINFETYVASVKGPTYNCLGLSTNEIDGLTYTVALAKTILMNMVNDTDQPINFKVALTNKSGAVVGKVESTELFHSVFPPTQEKDMIWEGTLQPNAKIVWSFRVDFDKKLGHQIAQLFVECNNAQQFCTKLETQNKNWFIRNKHSKIDNARDRINPYFPLKSDQEATIKKVSISANKPLSLPSQQALIPERTTPTNVSDVKDLGFQNLLKNYGITSGENESLNEATLPPYRNSRSIFHPYALNPLTNPMSHHASIPTHWITNKGVITPEPIFSDEVPTTNVLNTTEIENR